MNEMFMPFNVTDYLQTDEDMLNYLNAIKEEGGTKELIAAALDDIARARFYNFQRQKMSKEKSGTIDSPALEKIISIAQELGYRLTFTPIAT